MIDFATRNRALKKGAILEQIIGAIDVAFESWRRRETGLIKTQQFFNIQKRCIKSDWKWTVKTAWNYGSKNSIRKINLRTRIEKLSRKSRRYWIA